MKGFFGSPPESAVAEARTMELSRRLANAVSRDDRYAAWRWYFYGNQESVA